MRIAVFGGAGFLGSHVADSLTKAGHSVVVFDRKVSPWLLHEQEMIEGDIQDVDSVRKAVGGCEVVYNFAGIADIAEANARPLDTAKINILGNLHVIDACISEGAKRYVFASTLYVYSRAGGAYRCSKQSCEAYIEHFQRAANLDYTILRFGSLYGPRSDDRNGIHRFIRQAMNEGRIDYSGDELTLREYIHVLDAARVSVEVLRPEFVNEHVIISGAQTIHIGDLFRMIQEILDKKVEIKFKNDDTFGHYETTPYSYVPKSGVKFSPNPHVDLGQGLLMKMEELFHKQRP